MPAAGRLVAVVCALGAIVLAGRARADEPSPLVTVELDGRLTEPKARVLGFLGLEPGRPFGAAEQERLADGLDKLGYRLVGGLQIIPVAGGIKLRLTVAPVRVVRHIGIHGNFPLFEDEILRHLTLRSGTSLPPDEDLRAALDEEERNIVAFLARDGYFGGSVKITPLTTDRPEWIDLDIRLDLGQWYRLGSIVPRGKFDAVTTEELFRQFDDCCLWWGRFRIETMRESARKVESLLHERGYPSARVAPTFDFGKNVDTKTARVNLPVEVVQKRRVEVRFIGNRAASDKELREQLTIFTTGAYDDIELEESAKSIHRYYQQQGRFEAKVTFSKRRQPERDLEEATFLVEEGPELKVRRVDLVSESGAALGFSEDDLRRRAGLETKVFPTLGVIGLGEGGYVTNVQLQQDVDRLVELYHAEGYPATRVRAEVTRDPAAFGSLGALGADVAGDVGKKDDLYVRFYIDEGRHERIGRVEVQFHDVHAVSEAQVLKVLSMTEGKPFTEANLNADVDRINALFNNNGHPYKHGLPTGPEVTWNAAHDQATVRYQIWEGPAVTIGEIMVRGNFRTRMSTIVADLPFKKGDTFNLSKITEGERNLQTHLIFNAARVIPVGLSSGVNPVPILVTVQERYFEQVSLVPVFGVATDRLPNYAYVALGLVMPNFFGFGSQLELRGDFGFTFTPPYSWGVTLRYTDLRVFGPGWRFDLAGFLRDEVTNRLGPVRSYGASFGLTRFVTPALRVFSRYDLTQSNTNVDVNRLDGPHDLATVQDNTFITKITLGMVWDRRIGSDGMPNPLAPTKGWLLSLSVGWAFPPVDDNLAARVFTLGGGDHNFLMISGQAVGIAPLRIRSTEFTLIANVRVDEGIPFGESALPAVERLFGGGDTATRGYATDELKTEIVRGDVGPLGGAGYRVVPQGGNIRILSTLEFQFPIAKTFIGLPWPWAGALFYDVGAIFNAPNLVQVGDFKHSIGISLLRVLTPFGPLSFEYAYPITQSLAEQQWKTAPWYGHWPGALHFNWGIPLSRM